jgi:PAS domain S-box-containing protein
MFLSEQQTAGSSPEGEVVYRRVTPASADDVRGPRQPRLDPTLMPLMVGSALLLLFVIVLGNLGVRRVEDTSRRVLDLERQFAARGQLLLQLRIVLTRLDNEARDRMEAEARHELRPPFDLRLANARTELSKLIPLIDRLPVAQSPNWQAFHNDLAAYLETTKDEDDYSLHGFEQFQRADRELNELIRGNADEQEQILQQSEALANAAARSIKIWTAIAILAGLFVAAGTIWEAQRRYGQTRESTEIARREREFSNQMLEGMVSAIAAIDRNDRIRSANNAFFRIFPWANVGASVHDENASPDGKKLLEAATASHVESATYRGRWNLSENGAAHTFDVYSSPLEIEEQRGQIVTLVDVTEATKAEAALRRTEALAAVGEAAAQLAHEIKNPLGSIRLGVEMLREYATAEEAERTITLVERGIHHLNKLVVDVTQFSRQRQLERTEVDLKEVIDSSLDLVADRIQEKETPVERNYAPEEITGMWDAEQLRQILVNLLANAIDASEPRSPVTVTTELAGAGAPQLVGAVASSEKPRARIIITDQGVGMDPKTVARLYEPFFTTKKRGTGLGLSIVRQIIDLHGGSIEVQSERGVGTTFTIELPLMPLHL